MSVRSELRAMTADERARAAALIPRESVTDHELRAVGCAVLVSVCLLAGTLGAALGVVIGAEWERGALTGIAIGAFWCLLNVWRTHVRARRSREAAESDLATGLVEVLSIETDSVLEGPPRHGLPTYFVALGDGEHLFLAGAAVAEAGDAFPCRRFDVVRLPSEQRTVAIVPRGERLEAMPLEQPAEVVEDGARVRLERVRP